MSPRSHDDRDDLADEDLPALLDDLDRTLSSLRTELERRDESASRRDGDDRGREPRRRRRDRSPFRAPRPPRPPSVPELFRFTEQYTIPTVIAILETTIKSLELLRGVLRLADPDRSAFDRDAAGARDASTAARFGDGVTGLGRGAVSGVERALSELQTALSEADLPEDESSGELLDDARRLSEEVSDRLAAASERGRRESEPRRNESERREDRPGAVDIDVTGARGESESDEETAEGAEGEAPPEVDVEAELASIKDEVEGRSTDHAVAPADGDTDGTGDAADEGDDTTDEGVGSDEPSDSENAEDSDET
ncbi:MAG: hypothetical protein ABEJ97_03875 [Halobellus sp.]